MRLDHRNGNISGTQSRDEYSGVLVIRLDHLDIRRQKLKLQAKNITSVVQDEQSSSSTATQTESASNTRFAA